ncbi:hypothetical protein M2404_001084 [Rheinheimera pacifica]|uniref:hypothetical protein n=1 Tax=Rheinheimera pacifica TaxID=173990 RepID=UPI0021671D84|nr:hypothetical protein [Rheinheimera pacifica]MCS4306759.1 hypothetical protein [Rheinheimera pacifica]
MNFTRKAFFAFVLSTAFFPESVFATINSGWTKIRYIYPTGTGMLFVTEYKNTELSTCDGGSRFLLNINHPDYPTQVSALIAAFIAQKDVNLFIVEQPPACHALVDRFMVGR